MMILKPVNDNVEDEEMQQFIFLNNIIHHNLIGGNTMKITKRMMSLMLVLAMVTTMMVMPVSAANDPNFGNFPGVWQSSQYAVATVAVQKFLMLYGDSLAKKLMPNGGADGYCGGKTVECIKAFQERENLYTEGDSAYGKVNRTTWLKIGELLTESYSSASGGSRFWHNNRSYYTSLDSNEDVIWCPGPYYAINHLGTQISTPFYDPT